MHTINLLGYVVAALVCVYVFAFVLVGVCLLDASRDVSDCRNNVAGDVIAATLSPFTR